MIMKNEADNVGPLFDSVRDIIDYYTIVDTGSTDGTPDEIISYTKGWLNGEVHHRRWEDFATNRNQALELAKASGAKWALIMDADDTLEGDKKFPMVEGKTYFIPRRLGTLQWEVPNLVWLANDWHWEYPLHELLLCNGFQGESLKNTWMTCNARPSLRGGDTDKTLKEIEFLKAVVAQNPNDSRNWFYLASSYATVGDAENALNSYRRRIELGGWNEELYVSSFMIGRIKHVQGATFDEVLHYLMIAHSFSPERAEPLHGIAHLFRTKRGNYEAAYPWAKLGFMKELRSDFLFADTNIYNYGAIHEFMMSTYWTGRLIECRMATDRMAQRLHLIPEYERTMIEGDYRYVLNKLK